MSTMSRSYKLAISKDKGLKDFYWKKVRHVTNQAIKQLNIDSDDNLLPHPKEIMNDYDYSDYTIDYEFDRSSSYFWYNDKKRTEEHNKWVAKMKRK